VLPTRAEAAAVAAAAPLKLNAWIHVGTDDVVTLFIHKAEMGQGTVTSLSMLLAEELECDWAKIRTEFPGVDRAFGGSQGVFGSQSIRSSWTPLRQAGASARVMLVQAAAARWGVDAAVCRADRGAVVNTATNARLTYGSLAEDAARLPVPTAPALKDARDFRLIGTSAKRLDTPAKIDGTATFGIDVRLPGMLYAVVARCPVVGGTVTSVDDAKAKTIPGIKHVVRISSGVAVVADNTWSAMEGRKALDIVWNEGPNATFSSAELTKMFADLVTQPGAEARKVGDANAALSSAAKKIEAVYEVPFLAHAPMEPLNCTADVRADGCDVWASTQGQSAALQVAQRVTGFDPEKIKVHTLYMGGGFGRRTAPDYMGESVEISKAVGAPVKLTWSRIDDTKHDRYRPASYIRFAGGVDAEGWPVAHRVSGLRRSAAWRRSRRGRRCGGYRLRGAEHPRRISQPGRAPPDALLAIGRLLTEHVLHRMFPRRAGRARRQGSARRASSFARGAAADAWRARAGSEDGRLGHTAACGPRARTFGREQHRQLHGAGRRGLDRGQRRACAPRRVRR
jgi:isoquinoline 1-oxidoreductase beta subunit